MLYNLFEALVSYNWVHFTCNILIDWQWVKPLPSELLVMIVRDKMKGVYLNDI